MARNPTRPHPGQFQKGQSGNPGGVPKAKRHVMELARSLAPEAIIALGEILRDKKAAPAARVAAATAVLDRGYGRPPVLVSRDSDEMREALQYSDEELAEIIAAGRRGRDATPQIGPPEPDIVH